MLFSIRIDALTLQSLALRKASFRSPALSPSGRESALSDRVTRGSRTGALPLRNIRSDFHFACNGLTIRGNSGLLACAAPGTLSYPVEIRDFPSLATQLP